MNTTKTKEFSVEDKLKSLYQLQEIDSKIDNIRKLRGELPLEVQDLEDEITGLETRLNHLREEITDISKIVTNKKNVIVDATDLIKKYEKQQMNVRNNREFDSLSKEIEFQQLEIELAEKRIKENTEAQETKTRVIENTTLELEDKKKELKLKAKELKEIVAETEKEEQTHLTTSEKLKNKIESRLVNAYTRIRNNARNGLAIVTIKRNACGGCFNKIPPQRQLDIRISKKIIVCEYCGRILVDEYKITGKKPQPEEPPAKKRKTRRKK